MAAIMASRPQIQLYFRKIVLSEVENIVKYRLLIAYKQSPNDRGILNDIHKKEIHSGKSGSMG